MQATAIERPPTVDLTEIAGAASDTRKSLAESIAGGETRRGWHDFPTRLNLVNAASGAGTSSGSECRFAVQIAIRVAAPAGRNTDRAGTAPVPHSRGHRVEARADPDEPARRSR